MSKSRLNIIFLHALLFFFFANLDIIPFKLSHEAGASIKLLVIYYLLQSVLIVLWFLFTFGAKNGIHNKKDIFTVSDNFYLKVVYFIAGGIVIIYMWNLCFLMESFIESNFTRIQSNKIMFCLIGCSFLIPFLYTSKKIFALKGIQGTKFKKISLGILLSLLYFIILFFSLIVWMFFIMLSHRAVFDDTWIQMID